MAGLLEGRVVVVTGAGRGIGRGEALEFARQGARVVVNDLGGAGDGTGSSEGPAHEVVEEIQALGGEAVASTEDVADWEGAGRLIQTALDTFGGLDVLVNNAGVLRDKMLFNMSPEDFDVVVRVNLRGTFCTSRHAATYWREQSKAGSPRDARLINTSSGSGLYGNAGQTNYGAAKAGVASFTIIAAQELGRYGVTANAIAPAAQTRLIDTIPGDRKVNLSGGEWEAFSPDNIAPLVVWLGSAEAKDVTGRVFNVYGGNISVAEGWSKGPEAAQDARWDPAKLGAIVPALVDKASPNANAFGSLKKD